MTEQEWLECTYPPFMLDFLWISGKHTERKACLFGVAVCRRIWHLLSTKQSRAAVEVLERYADGRATPKEIAAARKSAWASFRRAGTEATKLAVVATTTDSVQDMVMDAASAVATSKVGTPEAIKGPEYSLQAGLLRDIFGNPFRPLPPIDPSLLAWNDGTVVKLAQGIYDERAFDRLPILADALEDAGCHDPDILAHCREPGEHVRGCWVVDLLTGRT